MTHANLLDETLDLISRAGLTTREMSEGAGLNYDWVAKVRCRSIPDPGVRRLQQLHDYLAARVSSTDAA
jgi:hypothetical protein